MNQPTETQLKKLKKLAHLKSDSELVLLESIDEIKEELSEKINEVTSNLNDKFDSLSEELKKKLESELVLEIDREELKGEDGKDYILTESDKTEIAKSITVPVVERVIEKTEVIREQPIVTNEIKEVAVLDVEALPKYGEKYRDGLELLPEGEKLRIDAIQDLKEELLKVRKTGEEHRVISANRNLYQLLDVNVSGITTNQSIKWNGTQWVPYTPSSGGGTWGSITGTLSDQTDLQTALDGKQDAGTYVTGTTDTTLTLTSTTLGLNLAKANTWTGQQTFNTSAPIIGTGTANGLAFLDSSKQLQSSTKLLYSAANSQIYTSDGGSSSSFGFLYLYDLTHSGKPVITIRKPTFGAALDLETISQSPIITATGGSTFVEYTQSETGTSLANANFRGASFDFRNDTDNFSTSGIYARGRNLRSSVGSNPDLVMGGDFSAAIGWTTENYGFAGRFTSGSAYTHGIKVINHASQAVDSIFVTASDGTTKLFRVDKDGNAIVPDEAYGSDWDGSLEVPTKNAVYDAIEAIDVANAKIASVGISLDGGGSAITTGTKGYIYIPYSGTVNSWTILADQSGSIVVDVKKCDYTGFPTTSSIAGTEKPTLSSAQKNQDTSLTSFTTAVTAGDIWEFVVDSASTVTRVNVVFKITKS